MLVLLGSKPGLDHVAAECPGLEIFVGGVDEQLTAEGMILPGLGDSGGPSSLDVQGEDADADDGCRPLVLDARVGARLSVGVGGGERGRATVERGRFDSRCVHSSGRCTKDGRVQRALSCVRVRHYQTSSSALTTTSALTLPSSSSLTSLASPTSTFGLPTSSFLAPLRGETAFFDGHNRGTFATSHRSHRGPTGLQIICPNPTSIKLCHVVNQFSGTPVEPGGRDKGGGGRRT